MTMPPLSSAPRGARSILSIIGLVAVWGCGASGSLMEPEAEPLAPDAIESVSGLTPYLDAYGISVIRVLDYPAYSDPVIEEVSVIDMGVQGRCVIRTYTDPESAEQFGPRSANEVQRPVDPAILGEPPSRATGLTRNNPSFTYGRHVALCQPDAAARRAFRALERFDRDAPEA